MIIKGIITIIKAIGYITVFTILYLCLTQCIL